MVADIDIIGGSGAWPLYEPIVCIWSSVFVMRLLP